MTARDESGSYLTPAHAAAAAQATDLRAEVERLRDIITRAARMAESERAGMVLQILRESA